MKVWNYVFISIGLMFLLALAGYNTGITELLELVGVVLDSSGIVEGIRTGASGLFDIIFDSATGIIGSIVVGGAIIAGFFTRAKPENIILLPLITGTLFVFVTSFGSVMKFAFASGQSWFSTIILLIFVPFTVGYIIALAEFFRGTD